MPDDVTTDQFVEPISANGGYTRAALQDWLGMEPVLKAKETVGHREKDGGAGHLLRSGAAIP